MKRKIMTVSYGLANRHSSRYTGEQLPMIRISNRFLLEAGFKVGTLVEVEYEEGKIVISLKTMSSERQN